MPVDQITSRLDGQVMDRSLDVYARLLKERIVFLGTQVDDNVANLICAQLLLLESEDPDSDVFLYINSPGGSVTAGMDLRHHAVRPVRRGHHLHGAGRVDGPVPALRGHA